MKRLILLATVVAAFVVLAAVPGAVSAKTGNCQETNGGGVCAGGSGGSGGGAGGAENNVNAGNGIGFLATQGGSAGGGGGRFCIVYGGAGGNNPNCKHI
jgi:hypothetical protein